MASQRPRLRQARACAKVGRVNSKAARPSPTRRPPGRVKSAPRLQGRPRSRTRPGPAPPARLTAAPRPTILAGMTPAETAGLTFADVIDVALGAGPLIAAVGIWWFGFAMNRSNTRRAEAEKNRHTEVMTAFKDAAENCKAMQAQAAEDRTGRPLRGCWRPLPSSSAACRRRLRKPVPARPRRIAAAPASMPPPVSAWNARAFDATSAAIRPDQSNARPGVSSLSASSAATALPTGATLK